MRRWTCLWARSSFGLRPEDKEYIYEECFQLVWYCKLSYESVWNMPVTVRKWWISRTTKQLKDEQEAQEKANKAAKGRK